MYTHRCRMCVYIRNSIRCVSCCISKWLFKMYLFISNELAQGHTFQRWILNEINTKTQDWNSEKFRSENWIKHRKIKYVTTTTTKNNEKTRPTQLELIYYHRNVWSANWSWMTHRSKLQIISILSILSQLMLVLVWISRTTCS